MRLFDTLRSFVGSVSTPGKAQGDQLDGYVHNPLNASEAMTAYRGDWLARKIVDAPVDDMTREWRSWQAEKDQITLLEAEERRLNIRGKVNRAMKLGRLMGGGALILGDGNPNPDQALLPERIGKGGLKYVVSVTRERLTCGPVVEAFDAEGFGEPASYMLTQADGQQIALHPSRVIRFMGAEVPEDFGQTTQGWSDSILDAIRSALARAGVTHRAVAALMVDARTDVIRIPALMERVATEEYRNRLKERIALANYLRSSESVLLMDKAEEYERKTTNFSNLADLLDRFAQETCGAADIPATRLWGRAPAGLNATGESDLTNYYDKLASEQNTQIDPRMLRLDELLIRSALGNRPPALHYTWNPLWRMTPKVKAEVMKLKAEATKIYADTGTVPLPALQKAVQNQLIEDGAYPGLEDAIDEAEKAGLLEPDPAKNPAILLPGARVKALAPPGGRGTPQSGAPPRAAAGRRPLQRAANDAAPRSLYVARPVVNAAELIAWAREAGFKTALPADQLHVTVAFSRRPLDWGKVPPLTGNLIVENSGWRWVSQLGDDGAVVLMIESAELRDRWQEFINAGASWDHNGYQPHMTISYAAGYIEDPWSVTPFQGQIILGPEEYGEVSTGGDPVHEVSTEEPAPVA